MPRRVAACWGVKAVLAGGLAVLFCVPYLLIGHHPVRPVRDLPLTWVDRAIGFELWPWVWVYQSVYLPINVIPWLATRRAELRRYLAGFLLLCAVSFSVFAAYPIRAPKPVVDRPTGMYWLLQQYDAPLNSLPSLHAGLLVYTLCFGRRILGSEMPRGLGAGCVLWAGLILYATLATKEHYAVDIVAGSALGFGAHWWAWRTAPAGHVELLRAGSGAESDGPDS